jgi:hypothetical protein
VITLCAGAVVAAPQSLRDLARAKGGPVGTVIAIEVPVAALPDVIVECDLAVRGRIEHITPHLSKDESRVVTDYVIAPLRVLKQRGAVAADKPGLIPIVVRRPGGSVIDGGYRLSTTVDIYPEDEVFREGEEVVVFLQYDSTGSVYIFTGGPFGAFRVKEGQVHAITRETASRRGDAPEPVSAFLQEVERMVAKQPK